MKNFVKNFIGKGKSVAGLEIVTVTCKLEELEKFAYQYEGIKYVTFEVAKMKQADNFGRDYTVYVSKAEEEVKETAQVSEPKPKTKKSPKVKGQKG